MFFHPFLVFLLSRSFKLFTHAPLDKLCLRLHRRFLPIVHLYDHTLFVQLSLVLPMKFLLRLLWAQNGFVNNQTHKHSPSSCMFLFTTSQTVFNIQKLPHRFRLTQNNVSIYFASFWKWRFHALTLQETYTRNPLWHYQHSKLKNWAGQKILRLIPCLFENHTFCAFASRTRDYMFFAPVPAVKLPLLPKSCVHMFISLFSEIFSHKMNKLK